LLFERPQDGSSTAIIVHSNYSLFSQDQGEFKELVCSAGFFPVLELLNNRKYPEPKFFLGKGKVDEIKACLKQTKADLVVLEDSLSPSQERNLEQFLKRKIIDRKGLILDIFAKRARTHEGKLQVELAKLKHESTRLVGGWTHLDRQRRGYGNAAISGSGLGGVGETQLEADQRIIGSRIKRLSRQLDKIISQRRQNRRFRAKSGIKLVALVGYTNAGKSTLFNMLCDQSVFAKDQLFATLDTTIRRISLPFVGDSLLVDTVGFINSLPPELIAAFKATLEELNNADLLLHVVDSHSSEKKQKIEDVNSILHDLGASEIPQLMVYNKRDLGNKPYKTQTDTFGTVDQVWVSGLNDLDRENLIDVIAERLSDNLIVKKFRFLPCQGKERSDLHRSSSVLEEIFFEDGSCELVVKGEAELLSRFAKKSSGVSKFL
jgi:GTP-binding protein HflX